MPPNDLKRIRFFVMARLRPGHPRLSCCYAVKTWMAGTSPAMTMKSIAAPHYEEGISKMTARGGQTLFVAINLFAFFVALLRFHRQRRDRAGFQPLQRDRLAGLLAIAVGVVLDALQRRVDLRDQLALAVAGAQFDRAVGFRRGAVGEIGMIDVLFLQGLQRHARFPEDLVLPRQQLGAKVIALALVHERLFFGGSIILQLFQGQPNFTCKAGPKRVGPRAPYIAASCDRQYRPRPPNRARPGFPVQEPVSQGDAWGWRWPWGSKLPGFGQFYLNAQLDLGQHRVEAGVAGGGFEVGGGVAQPAHRKGIEIAAQQPDLEVVQHVKRALAALHRTLAALGRILLDALQGQQRIDVDRGLRRGSRAGLRRRCRVRQRKAGGAGSPGLARRRAE